MCIIHSASSRGRGVYDTHPWGKVIFSQASVILLTGEVCQGDVPARETPLPGRPHQGDPLGDPPPGTPPPLPGRLPLPGRPPCQGDPPQVDPLETPTRETHCQGDPPSPGRCPCQGGPPPGPHPGGKLRGIRSRPTAKGEIEGDQIQAHTQGGN